MIKNKDFAYLFCFPLHIEKQMNTASEMKCFHLIWLKCCYEHTFSNIKVTKRDRERVGLIERSYVNGINDLEKRGLIKVVRGVGCSNRISINMDMLDDKSKGSVLNGR